MKRTQLNKIGNFSTKPRQNTFTIKRTRKFFGDNDIRLNNSKTEILIPLTSICFIGIDRICSLSQNLKMILEFGSLAMMRFVKRGLIFFSSF